MPFVQLECPGHPPWKQQGRKQSEKMKEVNQVGTWGPSILKSVKKKTHWLIYKGVILLGPERSGFLEACHLMSFIK